MSEKRQTRIGLIERLAMLRRLSPAARRRVVVGGGIVTLALLVIVVTPAYVASRPQFMERYSGVEEQYGTWAQSVHAKVSCQQCHVRPGVSRAVYTARMLGEFYVSFVSAGRQPNLLGEPTNDACSGCHLDLRTVSPAGDLNIPHKAHVTILKMKCIECHSSLVHQPEGVDNTPRMAACLKCHDGVTAKSECSACHTEKEEPLTHREPAWLVDHPVKADESCNKCHKWTADWCADCHRTKRPASHAKDWRAEHRLAVEKNRNCEACHEESFCVRCHGEMPKKNLDPALKLVR